MQLKLLIYVLASAVLYCCLLPLWNGFDEPFHYSYVESLLLDGRLPVLNRTTITKEIESSLALTPGTRFSAAISIEQWAHMSHESKASLRSKLMNLPRELRRQAGTARSYEAQQAPLGYLLMVPLDWCLSSLPLPSRILILRLCCSLAAAGLLWWGASQFSGLLGLPRALSAGATFCAFSTQMLWASVAHVGNDALAIPLCVLFLAAVLKLVRQGFQRKQFIVVSLLLTAGLLTKAYFLTFIPVWICLFVALLRRNRSPAVWVGPSVLLLPLAWYLRNLILYGSFSGTQESVAGIGVRQALAAAPRVRWLESIVVYSQWALWTGDWSFLSFSKITLHVSVLLLTVGVLTYFVRRRTPWLLFAILCFLAGLAYQTCVTAAASRGFAQTPEPWYAQGILFSAWFLAWAGFALLGRMGCVLGVASAVVTGWVALATYTAKLPLYYGAGNNRFTIGNAVHFWAGNPTTQLGDIILSPIWMFYGALLVFVAALAATVWAVSIDIMTSQRA